MSENETSTAYTSRRDRIRADMEELKAMWKMHYHPDIMHAITQMQEWSLGRPFIEYPNMQKLRDKFNNAGKELAEYQEEAENYREQLLKDGCIKDKHD